MMNLLTANFFRLKRDRVFWSVCAGMAAVCAGYLLVRYRYYALLPLENAIFYLLDFLCIPLSAFCSLFTGIEYADGTIRNKVIAGHSRTVIYLAQWLTNTAACVAVCAAYLAVFCAVDIPLTGLDIPVSSLITSFAGVIFAIAGYASLFTLIGMLCRSRAVGAVVGLLLAGGIIFACIPISDTLIRPRFYAHTEFNEAGDVLDTELVENPMYTDGAQRQAYRLLMDVLPGGQIKQMKAYLWHTSDGENASALTSEWPDASSPPRVMGFACAFITVTTCAGVLLFRQKNLQ